MTFDVVAQTIVLAITVIGAASKIVHHQIENGRRLDRLEWTVGQLCSQWNRTNGGTNDYILPPGKAGRAGSDETDRQTK